MSRQHQLVIGAFVLMAICVGIMAFRRVERLAYPQPVQVHVSPEWVKGDTALLSEQRPFILVEFGDYDCPACRHAHPRLMEILEQHKERVTLHFRQLPLSQHPEAHKVAEYAERARQKGMFDKFHSEAMSGSYRETARFDKIVRQMGLDKLSATEKAIAFERVETDMQDAKALRLSGTPAFFMCCPDGKIYQLSGYDQIDVLLKQYPR